MGNPPPTPLSYLCIEKIPIFPRGEKNSLPSLGHFLWWDLTNVLQLSRLRGLTYFLIYF